MTYTAADVATAIPFRRPRCRVAATLRASGRKPADRAYDALIAATAIANQLPLFTCNPNDFTGIPELDLVAVAHPELP